METMRSHIKLFERFGFNNYAFVILLLLFVVSCGQNKNKTTSTQQETNRASDDTVKSTNKQENREIPSDSSLVSHINANDTSPVVGITSPDVNPTEENYNDHVLAPSESNAGPDAGAESIPQEGITTHGKHQDNQYAAASANLCFSYFNKIAINESKDINVNLSSIVDTKTLLAEIQKKVIEQEGNSLDKIRNDSQSCTKVNVFKFVEIEIIDVDQAFVIIPFNDKRQSLLLKQTLNWRWAVKPKPDADVKNARLVIAVRGETADGSRADITTKDIRLTINIDAQSLWRKTWIFLYNNPESLLTLLILPLIQWIYSWFQKKKQTTDQ
jgi:hypothetical protein